MLEPDAHMFPCDLEKFKMSETFAFAYSVEVSSPYESSVPVFTQETINNQTIDELLERHPKLLSAVNILIQECTKTTEGKIALYKWDEARREDDENTN